MILVSFPKKKYLYLQKQKSLAYIHFIFFICLNRTGKLPGTKFINIKFQITPGFYLIETIFLRFSFEKNL